MVDPSVRDSTLSGVADAQSTSTSTSKPVGLADTDWVYLFWEGWINSATMPTATWPAGFTERYSGASATDQFQKFKVARKKITNAASEPATYTVSINTSHWHQCQAVAVRDADQTEPEDGAWVAGNNATGTGHPSVSKTTSAKCLLLWGECNENGTTPATNTPPTGYTELEDANYLRVASKLQAAAGSETTSGGALSASTQKMVALVALKGTASGSASGALSGSSAAVTGSISGAARDSGTIAGSVTPATGNLSASARSQALLGGTISAPVGDIAALVADRGTVTGAIAAPSLVATGEAVSDGTLSAQLSALSLITTGQAVSRGSLSPQVVPATGDLGGEVEFGQAVLAGTVSALSAALSGEAEAVGGVNGTIASPQGGLIGSSYITSAVAGIVTMAIAEILATVTTDYPIGQLAGTVPSPGLVTSGELIGAAELEGTLATPVLSMAGAVPVRGGLAGVVANLTANIQASSFQNGGMPVFGSLSGIIAPVVATLRQQTPATLLALSVEENTLYTFVEDNLKLWLEGDRDAYSVQ